MSNYTTKKEIQHATGVDIPNLAAKKGFVSSKTKLDKEDINKLVNVLISLKNLKISMWFRC